MAAAYVDVHLHLIFRHDSTRPRHTARAGGARAPPEPEGSLAAMQPALLPLWIWEPKIQRMAAATHGHHGHGRVPACSRKRGTARARRTHLGPQETRKEV